MSEKTSKRALYRSCDPFFRLWFRVVATNRALLAQSRATVRTPLARHGPWAVARGELMAKGVPDIHAGEKLQVVRVLFVPELGKGLESPPGLHLIDARTILGCLR